MLEVSKPHTNREAVGVWLCSDAKRPSKRSALVELIMEPLMRFTALDEINSFERSLNSEKIPYRVQGSAEARGWSFSSW